MDITQPEFIPVPWAANGQKASIPEEQTSAGNGRASWKTGFPTENTLPISQGGVPANYQDFQGVLYTLSEFACYQQAGGMFTWDATIDYQNGARVLGSDGKAYISTGKTGPSTTVVNPVGDTSGKWILDANMNQVSSAASAITQDYVTSGGYTVSGDVTYGGDVTVSGTVNGGGIVHLVGNETISGTKTFASTISGNITGSASFATSAGQATKLTTARTVQTNLGATTSATFDGTANIAPGVTGTLAVANGGTGVTTIADIQAGKDGAGNTITSTYATKADVSEEMATKADIDGNYPDMTVGNAEQIVSEDYLTDTAPYVFRTAGGNVDIGDREYDELVGGTIAWNQIFQPNRNQIALDTYTINDVTFTNNHDGSWTLSGTASANITVYSETLKGINGHKYLCKGCPAGGSTTSYYFGLGGLNIDSGNGGIFYWTYDTSNSNARFEIKAGTDVTGLVWKPQTHDLTAMFGTAIADYIYALEQANAGAGVAWFRRLFPKDYYAYDSGTLMSVNAASHDMVGFNQWDGQKRNGYYGADGVFYATPTATSNTANVNPIPVFPDTAYYFKVPNTTSNTVCWYDDDMNLISANTNTTMNTIITSPANAHFLNFKANADCNKDFDICINFSWSGYRNGEYEAYEKHSYPLDSTLTLRGIPKLDASNNLYYDGDTYEADGTVTRRYGQITFTGTATGDFAGGGVSIQEGTGGYVFCKFWLASGSSLSHKAHGQNGAFFDAVCNKYTQLTFDNIAMNSYNSQAGGVSALGIPVYSIQGNWAVGFSAYVPNCTTLAQYQTYFAANPIIIVYELATPTTETADAFQTPQIVNDFGTEQYVDAAVAAGTRDVAIPVGHNTRYMSNLKDKLRRLPNMPDNAGTYIVDYNSTTRRCSFTEYLDGAKITALESKIPDAPTADGTYRLTCTVAEGEVAYTWESDS